MVINSVLRLLSLELENYILLASSEQQCRDLNAFWDMRAREFEPKTQLHCTYCDTTRVLGDKTGKHGKRWPLDAGAESLISKWHMIYRSARMGYNVLSISPDTALFGNPYPTLKSYHFAPYKMLLPGVPVRRETEYGEEIVSSAPVPNSFIYVHEAHPEGTTVQFLENVVNSIILKVDATRKAKETAVDLLVESELLIQFLALGVGKKGERERWRKVNICAQPTDNLRLPSDVYSVAAACNSQQDLGFECGVPILQIDKPPVREAALVVPVWVSDSGSSGQPTLISRFENIDKLIPRRDLLPLDVQKRAVKVAFPTHGIRSARCI